IERELGRGAMGVVHLTHDTKLDRPVAIKSLSSGQNPVDLAAIDKILELTDRHGGRRSYNRTRL
ncbi:MAG: hypothetical protein ACYS14_15380, partial [Planctomycetota bacterium]